MSVRFKVTGLRVKEALTTATRRSVSPFKGLSDYETAPRFTNAEI